MPTPFEAVNGPVAAVLCNAAILSTRTLTDVVQLQKRLVGGHWFHFHYVQAGGKDNFVLQRVVERGLVHYGASAGIDHDGGRLHQTKLLTA